MSKKIGKALIYMVIILVLFTFVMLLECLVFQFPALRYKQKPIDFSFQDEDIRHEETLVELSEDEIRSIKVQRENEKMLAEYHGEIYEPEEDESLVETGDQMFRKVKKMTWHVSIGQPYYIHKISMCIPVESATGYRVTFYREGQSVGEDLYCSIEPKTSYGIANASVLADEMQMEITTGEDIAAEDIKLSISNSFRPNKMRIFYFFSIGLIILLLFAPKRVWITKPEWCFAIICFLLGALIIMGVGTNQLGYDEYSHAKSAYKMSFSTTIESTESAIQMCGNLLPHFSNPQERELVEAYENVNNDYSWADIGHQSRIKRAENRVYYPMALGFYLARKLNTSFAVSVELAKFGNLLFYIIVVFFAIKMAYDYKYIVAMIGLLPNCVFLASSISYDAMVNSFLLLGSVLVLNELLKPDQPLTWQNALMILLSFFIGSISKPIYILMALMMVFFPKKKFHSGWQRVVFTLAVIIVAGLMLYNIFKPTPSTGSDYYLVGNLSFAGDKRNVGTSVIGQLQYIIANPITFILLVFRSMWEMFAGYLFGSDRFLQYAYAGSAPKICTYFVLILFLWLSLFKRKGSIDLSIGMKYIVLNLIMIIGMGGVIWSSMYVSYTTVGADTISGVQGRYFIPLFLPFASCLMNNRLESRLSETWQSRIVFLSMAGINLFMIWQYVIISMNI